MGQVYGLSPLHAEQVPYSQAPALTAAPRENSDVGYLTSEMHLISYAKGELTYPPPPLPLSRMNTPRPAI